MCVLIVGIMVSLSPLATSVGWRMPARRASFDGSGMPHSTIASYWASRTCRLVGLSWSWTRALRAAEILHSPLPARFGVREKDAEHFLHAGIVYIGKGRNIGD